MNVETLAARLTRGDGRALARALSLIENQAPEADELVSRVFRESASASIVGLTGPPGVGKSTLADALAHRASGAGRRVAVLAVDPTSPVTGGALLGDRARMDSVAADASIFVRSMATRGHVGGLAGAAFEALVLLEAAGKDFVLLETVGAGQDEIEVAACVDVTVVVLAPGLGDELQASKAGMLEIADIVVVNKMDREGAARLAEELASVRKTPPIFRTEARRGVGTEPLYEELVRLSQMSRETGSRRRLVEAWLQLLVERAVKKRIPEAVWNEAVEGLVERTLSPAEAAESVVDALEKKRQEP